MTRRGARFCRQAAIAALAPLLAGCADLRWADKETGSTAGVEAALDECHALAQVEAWRDDWRRRWLLHPHRRHTGLHHHRPHYGFDGRRYLDLADFCMRAKGFELVEVEEAPTPPGSN